MIEERTSVGLDVHAHAIVGAAVDTGTGELFSKRLGPDSHGVVAWLRSLPGPVVVAYEAGPTGYTLARALADAGISCVVAAPSKIRRGPGDRVKTDRRDAELLARLLLAGDITAVTVPTVNQEAARDLVRAREDARVDLMKVRHRVSKLLLRYDQRYEGTTWTRSHLRWLRQQKFNQPARGKPEKKLGLHSSDTTPLTIEGVMFWTWLSVVWPLIVSTHRSLTAWLACGASQP